MQMSFYALKVWHRVLSQLGLWALHKSTTTPNFGPVSKTASLILNSTTAPSSKLYHHMSCSHQQQENKNPTLMTV
jgi:hypothetical protein